MKYRENIILLPCHSLEDFPLHHEGDDAQGHIVLLQVLSDGFELLVYS